jgi:hypothetical protein
MVFKCGIWFPAALLAQAGNEILACAVALRGWIERKYGKRSGEQDEKWSNSERVSVGVVCCL